MTQLNQIFLISLKKIGNILLIKEINYLYLSIYIKFLILFSSFNSLKYI